MYKPICKKTSPFLSAQKCVLSSFFQVFILLGMYNFVPNSAQPNLVSFSIEARLTKLLHSWGW